VTWALESLIPLLGAIRRCPYSVSGTSPIIRIPDCCSLVPGTDSSKDILASSACHGRSTCDHSWRPRCHCWDSREDLGEYHRCDYPRCNRRTGFLSICGNHDLYGVKWYAFHAAPRACPCRPQLGAPLPTVVFRVQGSSRPLGITFGFS
jgi:hypothetical protein